MDEFREKAAAGNLPGHDMPCWNEGMQPSKGELAPGPNPTASTTGGRVTETRRPDPQVDRELGRALTDALTDILSTEKEPRQRRNVS
jgi:hypothetical protein